MADDHAVGNVEIIDNRAKGVACYDQEQSLHSVGHQHRKLYDRLSRRAPHFTMHYADKPTLEEVLDELCRRPETTEAPVCTRVLQEAVTSPDRHDKIYKVKFRSIS